MHPNVAARSCSDCVAWMYDDRGGQFGKLITRRDGSKIPRGKGATPCRFCPKIPAGAEPRPENAIEMDEQGHQTVAFYRECRAVGEFPGDAIVRRNAAIIRDVEDLVEKVERRKDLMAITRSVKNA